MFSWEHVIVLDMIFHLIAQSNPYSACVLHSSSPMLLFLLSFRQLIENLVTGLKLSHLYLIHTTPLGLVGSSDNKSHNREGRNNYFSSVSRRSPHRKTQRPSLSMNPHWEYQFLLQHTPVIKLVWC